LIVCTISIIRRAVFLRGGSSSHLGLDVPAPVWQLLQQRLKDVVKTPMVPMNSSTGMPLSTWMFLKICSDISPVGAAGFAAAGAGACARAVRAGCAGTVAGAFPGVDAATEAADVCAESVVPPRAKAILVTHATVSAAAVATSRFEPNPIDVLLAVLDPDPGTRDPGI
jgi:hypothetical protein